MSESTFGRVPTQQSYPWQLPPNSPLETESQDTQQRFRRIFEAAPQAIGMADAKGNVSAVNPAFTRMFGYTAAEIPTLAICFEKVFPDPAYRAAVVQKWSASLEQFARTGIPSDPVVFSFRAKDGSERVAEIRSTADAGETIVFFVDITEQYRAEERARLWALVLEHSTEGIVICDAAQRILITNPAFERVTGYSEREVVGQTPRILSSGRQDAAFYQAMWRSIEEQGSWSGEVWNRRKNGDIYLEWLSVSAVRDATGATTRYVGIFTDITRRREDEARLVYLAHHDALTGLANRVLLIARMQKLLEAAARKNAKLAVLLLDLDRFKDVNDSLGHEAGDELLQAVARRLAAGFRRHDTVARMGGDEFVVLLPEVRDVSGAASLAQRLLARIAKPNRLRGQPSSISCSIGIAMYPADGTEAGTLLRNADAALYEAKRSGRNAYRFYTSELNARALELMSMETALRQAIEREEFVLHYQPQIDTASGRIVAAEALIRWHHPGAGLVPPGQFIPVAEDRGLIDKIGRWVIEETCRQIVAWDAAGLPAIPVAVNVSSLQFHQSGFVEEVARVIRRFGIASHRLELELTESLMVKDMEATIEVLQRLHDLGVRLAIDDFGSGYSSLNYLRRLPVDKVKIDQSFVQETTKHADTVRIIRGIIGLAKSLSLKVIAEGVETTDQLGILRAEGCDEVQGFLFSPALPATEFRELVSTWQLGTATHFRRRGPGRVLPMNPRGRPASERRPRRSGTAARASVLTRNES